MSFPSIQHVAITNYGVFLHSAAKWAHSLRQLIRNIIWRISTRVYEKKIHKRLTTATRLNNRNCREPTTNLGGGNWTQTSTQTVSIFQIRPYAFQSTPLDVHLWPYLLILVHFLRLNLNLSFSIDIFYYRRLVTTSINILT